MGISDIQVARGNIASDRGLGEPISQPSAHARGDAPITGTPNFSGVPFLALRIPIVNGSSGAGDCLRPLAPYGAVSDLLERRPQPLVLLHRSIKPEARVLDQGGGVFQQRSLSFRGGVEMVGLGTSTVQKLANEMRGQSLQMAA